MGIQGVANEGKVVNAIKSIKKALEAATKACPEVAKKPLIELSAAEYAKYMRAMVQASVPKGVKNMCSAETNRQATVWFNSAFRNGRAYAKQANQLFGQKIYTTRGKLTRIGIQRTLEDLRSANLPDNASFLSMFGIKK